MDAMWKGRPTGTRDDARTSSAATADRRVWARWRVLVTLLTAVVVLVGCSTGGPPALDALLGNLPEDFPWPILVAQHMPASFTGPLARRLDKR